MRQIVLDTETTGLNPRTGDRILEIGAVELNNRMLTGNNFHHYINPERDSEEGALAVHGLTTEFLSDKPKFAEIAQELRAFIAGAELIIHNAPFDIGFLNAEFKRLNLPPVHEQVHGVIDTLVQAKEMHPGKRNSLDALCDRYGVSNAHRKLHGALLDSELLADVYLAMTGGQTHLSLAGEFGDGDVSGRQQASPIRRLPAGRPRTPVLKAGPSDLAAHAERMQAIEKAAGARPLWLQLESATPPTA